MEAKQKFIDTCRLGKFTLAPGVTDTAIEICGTEGRLWISRSRYEFHPRSTRRRSSSRRGAGQTEASPWPAPAGSVEETTIGAPNHGFDFTLDHITNSLDFDPIREMNLPL
jgi:hypothetical protein